VNKKTTTALCDVGTACGRPELFFARMKHVVNGREGRKRSTQTKRAHALKILCKEIFLHKLGTGFYRTQSKGDAEWRRASFGWRADGRRLHVWLPTHSTKARQLHPVSRHFSSRECFRVS
jgi:hypothetical protein